MKFARTCTCKNPQFAMFNAVSAGWGHAQIVKYAHLLGKPICFFCGGTREGVDPRDCDHVTGGSIAMRLEEIEKGFPAEEIQ